MSFFRAFALVSFSRKDILGQSCTLRTDILVCAICLNVCCVSVKNGSQYSDTFGLNMLCFAIIPVGVDAQHARFRHIVACKKCIETIDLFNALRQMHNHINTKMNRNTSTKTKSTKTNEHECEDDCEYEHELRTRIPIRRRIRT